MMNADIGLIGLAVMGQNLVLNMNDHGFRVVVHNRTASTVDQFLAGAARNTSVTGVRSLKELANALKRPRKVMLMVKAGHPVDDLIKKLVPLLEAGDIIIDGGNSDYRDTIRRTALVESKGLLYVGTGVSGGEEGARRGPSIMPGGSARAWPQLKLIFQSVSAKAGKEPCCNWLGKDGAGHFVKMVHNGIEYGDMQLICEAYHLMKEAMGMEPAQMGEVFALWNEGRLDSYLVGITRDIMRKKDQDGRPLLDSILDQAEQKGTGSLMSASALEMGVPLTMITEAVQSRMLSALKEERKTASGILPSPGEAFTGERDGFLFDLENAVYASKIMSYAQGFMLLRAADREHGWKLDYGGIAMLWRGGCIIRSAFLDKIKQAYDRNPRLTNLLLDPYFSQEVLSAQQGWRRVTAQAVRIGIPVPAMSSALSFFDGYRRDWLPANLLQAQRDYFGAHTYQRTDRPRGEYFHTDWTGTGGQATSTVWKQDQTQCQAAKTAKKISKQKNTRSGK